MNSVSLFSFMSDTGMPDGIFEKHEGLEKEDNEEYSMMQRKVLVVSNLHRRYLQNGSRATHTDWIHCMCNANSSLHNTAYVGALQILEEAKGTKGNNYYRPHGSLVMAKFLGLMCTYLNISISKNIVPDESKAREIHHTFPMSLFLFAVIRPVCCVLMIALQLLGIYPSWLSWTFSIILNISVSLALYALVIFCHVFAKELAPHKPLAKLDVEHLEEALQNVLVIVEMGFFSISMKYAYTAAPYRTGSVSNTADKKKKNDQKTRVPCNTVLV
ncbi:Protein of unknown function (DUF300) [Abeliophyllum distichum]|uniref:Uncharacterized protein n=1 Tax=Abeliophyllum distichum TaxID=126358 RepID=A0ABD1UG92_9LAMI